ncbi:interferon-induced, double-stranded RNA-activated protein kinase-like isoform X2 [Cololabis saira]|uniref:interferon-induced, double-stranded RNA-activated protein kinase-like isoform X2 n=1 Tax=Cololabis saira TaxID=129043 RepID=UPI002AD4697E|nr:interferon-induced, double-stranded RNA-activated protein kinase-like isoform X2 [Cololabis saira]
MESINYIAKLNEYAHKTHLMVNYEDVGSVGPDHIKTFTIRAIVDGKAYPDGVGKNKKEAKQKAAQNAWRCLSEEPLDPAENVEETPTVQLQLKGINYTSWLNEYGQKHKLSIRPVETTRLGTSLATQCCRFLVGDKEYPPAAGKTKKEAKEEAAKLVYQELFGSETTDIGDGKVSTTPSQHKDESYKIVPDVCNQPKMLTTKTEDVSFPDANFIGLINSYCQKTKQRSSFLEEKKCGPSHSPTFFYKVLIDDKEYPVCEGKSVKEAKQKAAQMAWSALKEQSDWDSKVALSGDGSCVNQSPPTSKQDSGLANSASMTSPKQDSQVFTNSSHPQKDQAQSPDVKPKIKIAANFQNALNQSKEYVINFEVKKKELTQTAKTPTPSTFSRFLSDYDSIERLDKGSFGRVFKARQKLEEKYYAVKVVRCKEKALHEVKVLSDLNHCNIVRYHSCWIEDTQYQWDSSADSSSASQSSTDSSVKYLYIQMELCNNKTLRVWIDEKNIQNMKKSLRDSKRQQESLSITLQIVSGVEYIHSKMLIHRDLKPANIMFGRTGAVKIGDFGLVTAEIEDDAENLKERSWYKGTPSYMAPEQRNRIPYDRKVDIFSLGLIYFELLWKIDLDEKTTVWNNARDRNLPQAFSHHFHSESQLIKSMLCANPEDRPEACKLKLELEVWERSFAKFKTMQPSHHPMGLL